MKSKFKFGIAALSLTFTMLAGCDGNKGTGPCEHEWYDWEATTSPTATTSGLAERECALCGEFEEYELPVLTDSGYTKGRCTATCEGTGKQYYTYTNEEEDVEVEFKVNAAALGHDYVSQAAVDPTATSLGREAYYTCSRCDAIFNSDKQIISSLDEISVSYYDSIDAEGHQHGAEAKAPHTFGDPEILEAATMLASGKQVETCTACGYKKESTLARKDIGTLNKDIHLSALDIDGDFNSTGDNIYKVDGNLVGVGIIGGGSGMSKNVDGTIITGGKASSTGRVVVINTEGTVKMTMKGSTGKDGTAATFGEFDGLPNAEASNFKGTTATASTNSTDLYTFTLEGAGVHYFGGNATLKITWLEFEIHELDEVNYQKDATGHWYGNADPACTMRNDFEEHSYSAWSITKAATASETGIFSRTCSECGYVDQITIPQGEHNWKSEFSSDISGHWVECNDGGCIEKFAEGNHEFVIDSNGAQVCKVCGYQMSATIRKYKAHIATDVEDTNRMMADGDEFTGVSFSVKNGSYTSFDPAKEFTSIDNSTLSFDAGIKFTSISTSAYLSVTVPAACKVRIYAVCLTSTNLRFADNTGFAGHIKLNGEEKPENGALCTYEKDIAEAMTFYLGISSSSGCFVICGFEFIY